jgi:hypothetical protein
MALGYGKVAAIETAAAFKRDDFEFSGYKRRLLLSALGQTLIARWIFAYLAYSLRWTWVQVLVWRILKPVVLLLAWLFVLNWARRLK